MHFFSDPAFFALSALAIAGAAATALTGHSLKPYGIVVSLAMLAALFAENPAAAVSFAAYLLGSYGLFRACAWLFSTEHPHRVGLSRVAMGIQLAPMVLLKLALFPQMGFLAFAGLSYITFKCLQVLIECRDGLIKEMGFLDYLYFLVFFPTFTSGPITRSRAFTADAEKRLDRDEYLSMLYRGLMWLILGAVYKFVGAALANWALWFVPRLVYTEAGAGFVAAQLLSCFFYGLLEFFDFAGYSHMAMGVGLALGIEVPRNFDKPFLSIDIKDFWNRWHISLSHWMRDFVFMRLVRGLMTKKVFKSRVTSAVVGYMVNMTLIGIWHGVTPDYLIYGLYNGILLAACELMQKKWKFYKQHKNDRWFKVASWALTMIAIFIGFALFRGQFLHPVRF